MMEYVVDFGVEDEEEQCGDGCKCKEVHEGEVLKCEETKKFIYILPLHFIN